MNGNIFLRNDTILGVCQAIGDDLGFNPNYLRIALILPLFWFPVQMIVAYVLLGVAVMISRFAFPVAKRNAAVEAEPAAPLLGDAANSDTDVARAA